MSDRDQRMTSHGSLDHRPPVGLSFPLPSGKTPFLGKSNSEQYSNGIMIYVRLQSTGMANVRLPNVSRHNTGATLDNVDLIIRFPDTASVYYSSHSAACPDPDMLPTVSPTRSLYPAAHKHSPPASVSSPAVRVRTGHTLPISTSNSGAAYVVSEQGIHLKYQLDSTAVIVPTEEKAALSSVHVDTVLVQQSHSGDIHTYTPSD
jgi:hypothetical protein